MPDVTQFIGPVLVVGFIVIVVICVIADKNASKKFKAKIENEYKLKESMGSIGITENNEILLYCGSGSLPGYKVWPLEDVAYFGTNTIPATNCSFCFMDDSKKAMKGTYLTPSKKPLLQHKQVTFPAKGQSDLDQIYAFLKKHKSDLMRCDNGNISE